MTKRTKYLGYNPTGEPGSDKWFRDNPYTGDGKKGRPVLPNPEVVVRDANGKKQK